MYKTSHKYNPNDGPSNVGKRKDDDASWIRHRKNRDRGSYTDRGEIEEHRKNMLARRGHTEQTHNSPRANHCNIGNIHKCKRLSTRVAEKHQKSNTTQNTRTTQQTNLKTKLLFK